MKRIAFKTIDGIISVADLIAWGPETVEVENLNMQNANASLYVPNFKNSAYKYEGKVFINRKQIIWYAIEG